MGPLFMPARSATAVGQLLEFDDKLRFAKLVDKREQQLVEKREQHARKMRFVLAHMFADKFDCPIPVVRRASEVRAELNKNKPKTFVLLQNPKASSNFRYALRRLHQQIFRM